MRKNILTVVWILFVLIFLVLYVSQVSHQDDWKKGTTPLPEETVDLLCSRFGLSLDDRLCNGKKDVYAPDFVEVVENAFRPYEWYEIQSSEAATYEEVEEKIGRFKYKCGPDVYQAGGLKFFECSYDLRGDREFVMTFIYTYPEKAVMRIVSTSTIYDY